MAYVALYRKWRPKVFSDLVGQDHVSRTLSQAIESGHVGHAYLFSGPRGTGKTSTAKILAKALNCEKGPTTEPCNECENCRRVNDGTSMDVFEIDAASNRGIDEIRDLRETVRFAPSTGKYKVYIIDEVHMLTSEAFNALLKTLEEPPAQVVFILATTEIHKVPATIQSRCQRYDFKRIAPQEIEARLRTIVAASEIAADDDALTLIAREADGGMRDALSILDQCASLSGERVTARLVRDILGLVGRESILRVLRAIAARDVKDALSVVAEVLAEGKDIKVLVTELIAELRAVMVFQAAGGLEGMELYETDEEALRELAKLFPPRAFMPMLRRLHEALAELRWTTESRIAVETALLTLCRDAEDEGLSPRDTPSVSRTSSSSSNVTIAALNANEARITRLETRIAEMEGMLAAGGGHIEVPSVPHPRVETEVMPAVSTLQPGAKESDEEARGTNKSSPRQTRITRETGLARPAAVRHTEEEQETDGASFDMTPEGALLWERLLESLKADAKSRIIHACVANGKFGGMTRERFCIVFVSPFLVRQVSKYKATIENLLTKLSGRTLGLVAKTAKPVPKPMKKARPKAGGSSDIDALPPDERPFVEQAISIFDGQLVSSPASHDSTIAVRSQAKPQATGPHPLPSGRGAVDADDVMSYDEDFAHISDDDYIPPEEPM